MDIPYIFNRERLCFDENKRKFSQRTKRQMFRYFWLMCIYPQKVQGKGVANS